MSDLFDPWQIPADDATPYAGQADAPTVQVNVIEGIEPLSTQIGIFPKRTVPETLQAVLFGQPEPNRDEIATAGSVDTLVPAMRTYAILDASKVMGLPDLLENSGLEHRCLFKGNAYDEMKDVAPWLVRLEDGNGLTRNIFTLSDAPWHLWSTEPGIYVCSRHDLDSLWRHFRKFTRIQDRDGKWFYNRFWDADASGLNFPSAVGDPALPLFEGAGNPVSALISIDTASKSAFIRTRTADGVPESTDSIADGKFTFGLLRRAIAHLMSYSQGSIKVPEAEMMATARAHIADFHAFGLKTAPATGLALGIIHLSGRPLHSLSTHDKSELTDGDGSQYGRYRRLFDQFADTRF